MSLENKNNLPEGWELKRLGEIASVEYGYTSISDIEGHYRYIRITDINTNGELIQNDKKYINYSKDIEKFVLNDKDLLMARTGATFAKVLLFSNHEKSVFASYLIKINFNIKIINKLYWYFSKTDNYWKQVNILSSGSAQPHFNGNALKNVIFQFPKSISEQQRIVSILDEAFVAIGKAKANAEQNLKNSQELFESYLQSIFENKGDGWEEKKLGDICVKITDGSHNPPKGIEFSEYLMLSSKNVNNDYIDLDSPRYLKKEDFISENKRTEVVEGDVLLTIVGTIGRVAVVTNEHKYFTLQRSVAVLKPKNNCIASRFLMFSLRNILKELNENARGVAQKGLYLNQIRIIEISIPKLKTQQIIVEKIDYLLAETKKLETIYQKKLKDLEELKKSILEKAFSGQLKIDN